MSRERKVNYQCHYCGKNGIGYVTEEYRNDQWEVVSEAIPNGWSRYRYNMLICPQCDDNPKVRAAIRNKIKSKDSSRIGCLLALASFSILIPGISAFTKGSFFLGIFCFAIVFGNTFIFKKIGTKKSGYVISVILLIIEVFLALLLLLGFIDG